MRNLVQLRGVGAWRKGMGVGGKNKFRGKSGK